VWVVFRSAVAVNAAGSAQSPLHSLALKLATVAASHAAHGSLAPQVPVLKLEDAEREICTALADGRLTRCAVDGATRRTIPEIFWTALQFAYGKLSAFIRFFAL
jgi:hypothetical protein